MSSKALRDLRVQQALLEQPVRRGQPDLPGLRVSPAPPEQPDLPGLPVQLVLPEPLDLLVLPVQLDPQD